MKCVIILNSLALLLFIDQSNGGPISRQDIKKMLREKWITWLKEGYDVNGMLTSVKNSTKTSENEHPLLEIYIANHKKYIEAHKKEDSAKPQDEDSKSDKGLIKLDGVRKDDLLENIEEGLEKIKKEKHSKIKEKTKEISQGNKDPVNISKKIKQKKEKGEKTTEKQKQNISPSQFYESLFEDALLKVVKELTKTREGLLQKLPSKKVSRSLVMSKKAKRKDGLLQLSIPCALDAANRSKINITTDYEYANNPLELLIKTPSSQLNEVHNLTHVKDQLTHQAMVQEDTEPNTSELPKLDGFDNVPLKSAEDHIEPHQINHRSSETKAKENENEPGETIRLEINIPNKNKNSTNLKSQTKVILNQTDISGVTMEIFRKNAEANETEKNSAEKLRSTTFLHTKKKPNAQKLQGSHADMVCNLENLKNIIHSSKINKRRINAVVDDILNEYGQDYELSAYCLEYVQELTSSKKFTFEKIIKNRKRWKDIKDEE